MSIQFYVNQPGKVGVELHKGTDPIRVLALREDVNPGTQTYVWDGKDQYGSKVSEGVYIVRVIYYDTDFTLFKNSTVTVDYNAGGDDVITSDYVTPNPFDPTQELTKIYFTLNEEVDTLKVDVEQSNGTEVVTLKSGTDVPQGTYLVKWNGKDKYNEYVDEGPYTYKIHVTGSFGEETELGNVDVDYDGGPPSLGIAPNITNDYATPSTFDPNTENTAIKFTLNTDATVSVKVYDGSTLVDTVLTSDDLSGQSHSYTWDGRKSNNDIAQPGTYTYKVTADNAYGDDEETGLVTVDYTPNNTVVAPIITNGYATPDTIDPSKGETMNIYYTLNTCAYVQAKVYDPTNNDEYVDTLQPYEYECAGEHFVVWDGRDSNGAIMHDGDYKIVVTANNSEGTDEETEYVDVDDDDNNGNGNLPDVYDLSVNRDEFDPDDESVTLTYKLDECADVTIKVYDDDDDHVVTLADDEEKCSGTYTETWDGEDSENDEVDDGDYYFKVYASNNYGSDSEREYVEVDSDGDDDDDDDDDDKPKIDDVDVDPEVFNPYHEEAELEFELNTCADVTIEVRDDDDDLVYEIIDDKRLCKGKHDYDWDGEDEDNDYVREDDYEFYIRAENDEGTDTERIEVEVDYDGYSYGSGERCANYLDVSNNDPYCDAIEYVTGRGIFDGYPDGTFKPYQAINRAETSKVIIKGFDYPILSPDGTNLGFWDLLPEAWYIPYIKTGKAYGILQGYPDGSFQPARTVNRVELLKIFLESANVALPTCSVAPYADTPVQADTEWYIPYVCYAKMYDLMDTDYYNHFNPDKPMTRGDVAELFYRFSDREYNSIASSTYYDGNDYYYSGYTYGNTTNSGAAARLSNVELSDDDIEEGDSLTIYYNLNVRSEITVEVLDDDDDVVRELADDLSQSEGRHSIYFNGEDDDGDDLDTDDYTIRIVARNYYGSDVEEIEFEVVDDDDDDDDDYRDRDKLVDVYDLDVDPEEFDPDTETVDIGFRLTRTAEVTVKIYDEDDDLVIRLIDEDDLRGGYHEVEWDGDDDDNDQVDDGDYRIVIEAESSLGDDEEEIYVEVQD